MPEVISKCNVELVISYIAPRLPEEYHPKVEDTDWKIFGPVIQKYFGPSGIFPPEYKETELLLWVKHRVLVTELLKRVQCKLFNIETMLNSTTSTDAVQMRIIVSMLNKTDLPERYKSEIFDNLIMQYRYRKPVFEDYYVIRILGLPF